MTMLLIRGSSGVLDWPGGASFGSVLTGMSEIMSVTANIVSLARQLNRSTGHPWRASSQPGHFSWFALISGQWRTQETKQLMCWLLPTILQEWLRHFPARINQPSKWREFFCVFGFPERNP